MTTVGDHQAQFLRSIREMLDDPDTEMVHGLWKRETKSHPDFDRPWVNHNYATGQVSVVLTLRNPKWRTE